MSNIEGNLPLHQAAKAGELNVVKDLLAKGADKEERNDLGETSLMVAAFYGRLVVLSYLVGDINTGVPYAINTCWCWDVQV